MYVREPNPKVQIQFWIFLKPGIGKITEPLLITNAIILLFYRLVFKRWKPFSLPSWDAQAFQQQDTSAHKQDFFAQVRKQESLY